MNLKIRKMHKANNNFKNNLQRLKDEGDLIISRPSYTDGTQSKSISIKQVFEQYDTRTESVIHNFRPTAIKSAIQEIFWIYQDQSNKLEDAEKRGVTWWSDWNVGDGTIGKAYGETIREYDLLNPVLDDMIEDPHSRRHIIDMWQINHIRHQYKVGGLVPCAYSTIWSIDSDYNVDMTLLQRSSDKITAKAINIVQYVALGLMICGHLRFHTGKKYILRHFSHYTHDLHIYDRHLNALDELLEREPSKDMQTIELLRDCDFYDYTIDDFKINKIKIDKIKSDLDLAV